MRILGLDTATGASVAAVLTDAGIWEAYDDVGPGERPRHTTRLLELTGSVLGQAGLDAGQLDRIAVGIGPGTFTGLRIGIATARGLGFGSGAELVGVGSLRALCTAVEGPAVAVLDARRSEAFVAVYAGGEAILEPTVVGLEQLGEVVTRAAPADVLAVGEGAIRFRSQLEDVGVAIAPDASPLHRVSAATICRLAAADDVDARGSFTPLYLRLPDAEIALRESTS